MAESQEIIGDEPLTEIHLTQQGCSVSSSRISLVFYDDNTDRIGFKPSHDRHLLSAEFHDCGQYCVSSQSYSRTIESISLGLTIPLTP